VVFPNFLQKYSYIIFFCYFILIVDDSLNPPMCFVGSKGLSIPLALLEIQENLIHCWSVLAPLAIYTLFRKQSIFYQKSLSEYKNIRHKLQVGNQECDANGLSRPMKRNDGENASED